MALIVKWIYRYANELDSLWRRVVNAKSGVDSNSMLHPVNSSGRKSLLFNLIASL